MYILSDIENNGLGFKINYQGNHYSGIITCEALLDHFNIPYTETNDIKTFFDDKTDLLEQEICSALQRHPPLGKHHILILPHHLR